MIKLKIKYGNSQTDLRFPCTEKEMNAALERIHAEDVTPLELYTGSKMKCIWEGCNTWPCCFLR